MKSLFKKKKVPDAKVPRQLEDITAEYNQLRAKAADSNYQVYVHARAVEEFNQRMLELNQEGAARNDLNRQRAQEEAKEQEKENQNVQP